MLIVLLVTPWSVEPVACPGPQGDGRVPNFGVDDDEVAPLTVGEITTPAPASVVSRSATATPRMPMVVFITQPPGRQSGNLGRPDDVVLGTHTRTGSYLVRTLATNGTVLRVHQFGGALLAVPGQGRVL